MEMVLRWKLPGIIAVPWERIARGCLILILSCVLYCCVRIYAAGYGAGADRTSVSGGIMPSNYSKDVGAICADMKYISMNPCRQKIRVNIEMNVTERTDLTDKGLAVMEPDIMDAVQIGSLGNTLQNPELPSEITEENKRPEAAVSDVDGENMETDVPFLKEDDILANEEDGVREIAGFSVDAQGYISGITDNLVLTDGILFIPAEEGCVGIRANAFSDIEEEVMEIYIPANIHDIEQGAFESFTDLMFIEAAEGNPCYYSLNGILYSESGEEIMYPSGW